MSEPVFFCYSDHDLQIVSPLLDELRRLDIDGRKCFTRVPPHEGNAAADILRRDIESSRLLVVFLTDGVVFSDLYTWQIQMACSYGLDTIVVRLTSNEPAEPLGDALESAYWIDALDRPLEDVTNQLVDVVCAKLGL